MANDLIGEEALPDSVQSRRESLRSKVSELREPIRRRRESSLPGPDLIGRGEEAIMDARDRVTSRDSPIGSILSRIRGGEDDSGNKKEEKKMNKESSSDAETDAERRSNSLI